MPASLPAKTPRKALPAKLRKEILWSGPCAYCGDFNPTQVDHVIPVSCGGTDDRENLVPACRMCNMEKLDFTPEEWRAWREGKGLGWPPPNGFDRIKAILDELRARYPGVQLSDLLSPIQVTQTTGGNSRGEDR